MSEALRNVNVLTSQPIPELSVLQLGQFDRHSLFARETRRLNPVAAKECLLRSPGAAIRVIDVGGTALKYTTATVNSEGHVQIDGNGVEVVNTNKGSGYIEALLDLVSAGDRLPVGVSTAGVVENGMLLDSPNAPDFAGALNRIGGFRELLGPKTAVMNDAEAGVIAGATGIALMKGRDPKHTLYVIDGGGIGGAAMDSTGQIISMEPGHIRLADPALNPNGVTAVCGLLGRDYTCLERIGASGAGIEAQWFALTGQHESGRQIAERMYAGDKRALTLFENSALIIATIIEGMRESLGFPVGQTDVVLHGGGFKTEGMVVRVRQILEKHHREKLAETQSVELIPTGELGMENACMAGLAIAALME